MTDLVPSQSRLDIETFQVEAEAFFKREFYPLLLDLGSNATEIEQLHFVVTDKYIEMRKNGFSEHISLSELQSTSDNVRMQEISQLKEKCIRDLAYRLGKQLDAEVVQDLHITFSKFEKMYASEWLHIVENEPDLLNHLKLSLENSLRKDKCLRWMTENASEYKVDYLKTAFEPAALPLKEAESHFHVLIEVLRINKDTEYAEEAFVNTRNFFAKSQQEKIGYIARVVDQLNKLKYIESIIQDEGIHPAEKGRFKLAYLQEKQALTELLVSSKKVKSRIREMEMGVDFSQGEDNKARAYLEQLPYLSEPETTVASTEQKAVSHPNRLAILDYFRALKKQATVLLEPFYDLVFGIRDLWASPATVGEKLFRIGVVWLAFIGLFLSLVAFVYFEPNQSAFYHHIVFKIPIVMTFYWAALKLSREIFDWTGTLYRYYERLRYGIEGHVEFILTEKAKSYFREMELLEIRDYFIQEVGNCQKRLREIENKNSEDYHIELNVMRQLGVAWRIIQSGGIGQDRIKTVKAVQLCLKEIYKIRSSHYQNQFWRYDESNAYNVLGVFMQNVKYAENQKNQGPKDKT